MTFQVVKEEKFESVWRAVLGFHPFHTPPKRSNIKARIKALVLAFTVIVFASLSALGQGTFTYHQLPNTGPMRGVSQYADGITREMADDFTTPENTRIESVAWWGAPAPYSPATEDFRIELLAPVVASGSLPGPVLYSFEATVTATIQAPSANVFSLALPLPFETQANHQYWLSITTPDRNWGWLIADSADHVSALKLNGGGWDYTGLDFAFAINQTIPEPGTLALAGLGFLGFLWRFRPQRIQGCSDCQEPKAG